jgi:hypothetical protein
LSRFVQAQKYRIRAWESIVSVTSMTRSTSWFVRRGTWKWGS